MAAESGGGGYEGCAWFDYMTHTVHDSPYTNTRVWSDDDERFFQESLADDVNGPESPSGSYDVVHLQEFSGYDPSEVNTSPGVIASFIDLPLRDSLLSVPGIGVVNRNLLVDSGVGNTHQLVGRFLLLQEDTTNPRELANRFHTWLGETGIRRDRSTITVSVAGKVGTWFAGIYDPEVYKTKNL